MRHGELVPDDLSSCLSHTNYAVLSALKSYPRELVVAGGLVRDVVRGDEYVDVDVFASSKEVALAGAKRVLEAGDERKLFTSIFAATVSDDAGLRVQFSFRRPFDDPSAVIRGFDFTVSQGSFWCDDDGWRSSVSEHFYPDVRARRLRYCAPEREEDAGGSFLRLLKLYRRGYRASFQTLGRVTARFVCRSEGTGRELSAREVLLSRDLLATLRASDVCSDSGEPAYLTEAD